MMAICKAASAKKSRGKEEIDDDKEFADFELRVSEVGNKGNKMYYQV